MANLRPVVVVIEDHAKLRRLVRGCLQADGCTVREAADGQSGLKLAATKHTDLVIVDLGLPDMDGLELVRQMRGWWASKPILVLSGRVSEAERIGALEAGADDFVGKPFSLPEFQARVRAALRRAARHVHVDPAAALIVGDVSIDTQRREVLRHGAAVEMTPNEFRVLSMLARNAGILVTTDTLAQEIWGPEYPAANRHYLRTYVAALRQKLEANPANPTLLLTEPGVGYRLAFTPS